jgi:acetyltransferase
MTAPIVRPFDLPKLDIRTLGAGSHGFSVEPMYARPYPKEFEEYVTLRSGRLVLIRPIRPEDERAHAAFAARLSPVDVRFRFFAHRRVLSQPELVHFTHIDYGREMAFIATASDEYGGPETLGVVRVAAGRDEDRRELAIIVRSDLKRQGLGAALLEKMIRYCRASGIREIVGQVLAENKAMLGLAQRLGFQRSESANQGVVEIWLSLDSH